MFQCLVYVMCDMFIHTHSNSCMVTFWIRDGSTSSATPTSLTTSPITLSPFHSTELGKSEPEPDNRNETCFFSTESGNPTTLNSIDVSVWNRNGTVVNERVSWSALRSTRRRVNSATPSMKGTDVTPSNWARL